MPSSQPSRQPSSIPSEQPTGQPSVIPSLQPSSIPSVIPSTMPSTIPSLLPTTVPSTQPTGHPSETPSSQPSCTPSMAPTDPATSFLFYPDWKDGVGCKNDGKAPNYMEANPSNYMSSTLATCCSTYFGWNLNSCMGNERGVCVRALYYPDWGTGGKNTGCINDGNEPAYMTDNALTYLFTDLKDCCEKHYSWDINTCVGATGLENANMYYPDWVTDKTCKKGGGQPQYMNNSPSIWLHATLQSCCSANYSYDYKTCMASESGGTSATPAAPGLFYPDWISGKFVCLNDNGEPSYMSKSPDKWMHKDLGSCCEKNFGWHKNDCIVQGSAAANIPIPDGYSVNGSGKFYKRSTGQWMCVQDCIGASPCGGLMKPWEEPNSYATRKACCNSMWEDEDCMTRTISSP